jgi:hypothetical protein
MNYDGTDRIEYPQLLRYSEGGVSLKIDVMDDWIYCRETYNGPLFRIKADGSGEPQTEPFAE